MGNYVLETFLAGTGFFLIFILLSEDFPQWVQRLQATLRRRPRLKFVAYPVAALLLMGAAALTIQALMFFVKRRDALRFPALQLLLLLTAHCLPLPVKWACAGGKNRLK